MNRFSKVFLLLIVVLNMFACANQEKAINRKVKILEEEAGLAIKTQNYALAEEKLEAILELSPDQEHIKNNLAVLSAQYLNKQEKAIRIWEEILEKNPRNAAYYNNIAGLYWQMGQLDKALKTYQDATKHHPTYHMPYYNMAQIYLEQKDFPSAEKAAAKGYGVANTDTRMIYVYARTLLYNDKFAESTRILQEARNRNPKTPMVNLMLSRMYLSVDKYDEAQTILDETLGENPTNPLVLAELVEVHLQKKTPQPEIDKIMAQITAADAKSFDPWFRKLFTARKHLVDGRFDGVQEELNALEGKIPSDFSELKYFEGLRLWAMAEAQTHADAKADTSELRSKAFYLNPERIPYPDKGIGSDSEEDENEE